MNRPVDLDFVVALPKAELHAHLSGSISKPTLHAIWLSKRSRGECLALEDPMTAIRSGSEASLDIVSFFPLFDSYIYHLVNDVESVRYATRRVIDEFLKDGVVYLELRTTPRANSETRMTVEDYVAAVNEVVEQVNASNSGITVFLILSVDRKMTLEQANAVVDLAVKYKSDRVGDRLGLFAEKPKHVVGIDLCGDPAKGDISAFTPTFQRAKKQGLRITLHFAEVSQSSTLPELETLLSWNPDRLGHVIKVPMDCKEVIRRRQLGLELCLSCNVMAKLTTGGFAMHHFGKWLGTDCPIALSTDDVGVFGSPLSNEYLLAAQHFNLSRRELVELSRGAMTMAFGDTDDMQRILIAFQQQLKLG